MGISACGLSSKHVNTTAFAVASPLLTQFHASFCAMAMALSVLYTGVMWGISAARIPLTVTVCVYRFETVLYDLIPLVRYKNPAFIYLDLFRKYRCELPA